MGGGGEGLVSAEATGVDALSFNLVQIGPKEAGGGGGGCTL